MKLNKMVKFFFGIAASAAIMTANTSAIYADTYMYDANKEWKLSSVVSSSGYDVAPSQKYAYKKLTSNEKKLYTRLVNGIENLDEKVELPAKMTTEELTRVYHTVFLEEPELFWIGDSFDYDSQYIYPSYKTGNKSEIAKMQKSINKAVSAVLKKAAEKKDDYDKIGYFHDYIITKNYHSDNENDKDTHFSLYEAFVGHYPLTEDKYAAAMQYLCDLSGIECVTVISEYTVDWNKGKPAYVNIVKSNGNWYNINVAADDDMGNDQGDKNYISRFFMMIPDKWLYNGDNALGKKNTIKLTAKKDCTLFTPPVCTKTADNYFTRNKLTFSSSEKAQAEATKQLAAGMKSKSRKVYCRFRCTDTATFDYMKKDSTICDVYYAASEKYTNKQGEYVCYYDSISGVIMYCFTVSY